MTDFNVVKEWVRKVFPLVGEADSYILFDVQGVRMRVVRLFAEDWVAIAGVVCDDDRIPFAEALAYNRYRARVGALAIESARYQLRQLLPCGLLDEAGFHGIVSALAREILALVRAVCREVQSSDGVFANYCD